MSNQIVVLGGGLVGRFAKVIMPEVIVLERMDKEEKIIGEFLGANMSRLPVPEIEYTEGFQVAKIDGNDPTLESIRKYKLIKTGNSSFDFGDVKQFIPRQKVFFVKKPEVDIEYNCNVIAIDIFNKKLILESGDVINYGCLISTISMNILLNLIELFKNSILNDSSLLPHKPIYFKEIFSNKKFDDENILCLNAITDSSSIIYREQYCGYKISYESYFFFSGTEILYPGKILYSQAAEEIAKDLQLYSIYCYGRYGRWRAKEHLHETFKNIRRFSERKGQIGYS